MPGGGLCNTRPCWSDQATGFTYRDHELSSDGAQGLRLKAGAVDGAARIIFKGKGQNLALPDLSLLTGPIDVQLRKSTGSVCWGATYSPPFLQNDGVTFKDTAD